jgi:Ca-activated chloride channel family protein
VTWRIVIWGVVAAVTVVVAWLWPRIDRAPSDFEIGYDFLNREEPGHALLFFEEARWRGVAAYRVGRYAEASREFATDSSVASLFNLGNSYAQLRDWPNAIAAYERVLRFDPNHEDARFNLALVKTAAAPPPIKPVDVEAPLEMKQQEGEEPDNAIPQDATPQSTRARESEQSDKAGNTSDTDEAGETDERRPRPQNSTGDSGRAGAVGETSEEEDRGSGQLVGTVDLKPRNSSAPAEILLRRITDDPEKVLKARLQSAYESRIGKGRE